MYLKRKIDGDLAEWKARVNHKPLIVQGARQIGKTASIRKFARENYEFFVEINFILLGKLFVGGIKYIAPNVHAIVLN